MGIFYNRLIPWAARLMWPLFEALKGKTVKQAGDWTEERDQEFADTKTALAKDTTLTHPAPKSLIAITTDASGYAVYEQWVKGAWQPLTFFSLQLRLNERKYSTFDRELLGLAIQHFRFLLEAGQFTALWITSH